MYLKYFPIKFVLFISGLELQNESVFLSLQLLIDYLTGHLGSPSEQSEICNIVRIVIAGNSICGTGKDVPLHEKVRLAKLFDDILTQLSNFCPVDLMPGEFDPSNHVMPQQPFHSCLFPKIQLLSILQLSIE
ncbi:DNA polymerase delta small subunit, partial [Armadillidium vulgare]